MALGARPVGNPDWSWIVLGAEGVCWAGRTRRKGRQSSKQRINIRRSRFRRFRLLPPECRVYERNQSQSRNRTQTRIQEHHCAAGGDPWSKLHDSLWGGDRRLCFYWRGRSGREECAGLLDRCWESGSAVGMDKQARRATRTPSRWKGPCYLPDQRRELPAR